MPDGRPYQILEPGDPPIPAHDADTCGRCTFVANADCIVVTPVQRLAGEVTLSRALRAKLGLSDLEDTIIGLGRFTLPGWNGHNMFWLFTCPVCQVQGVDYLHGYRLYLKCGQCGEHLSVEGKRFYEAAGRPMPPSRWRILMHAFRQRRERRRNREARA